MGPEWPDCHSSHTSLSPTADALELDPFYMDQGQSGFKLMPPKYNIKPNMCFTKSTVPKMLYTWIYVRKEQCQVSSALPWNVLSWRKLTPSQSLCFSSRS